MTDLTWVISSSVLILIVLLVRALFGKRMSAGLRYALWALVLVRLLIPGTIFKSPVSVKTAVMHTQVAENLEAVKDYSSITVSGNEAIAVPREGSSEAVSVIRDETPERIETYRRTIRARDVLSVVWYTGMGLVAAYIVYVNLRFYLKLRERRVLMTSGDPCRVYYVNGLESSCLFLGSIYVSEESIDDPERLNCIISHELAHRRHCDWLFTVLRSVSLIVHWYNPLVWYSAYASRQDSELFADAGALRELGEECREVYGKTLIDLSARPSVRASIACTATSMANNKRALKQRVEGVAYGRKMGFAVAAIVLAAALAAFAGAVLGSAATAKPASPGKDASGAEPTAQAATEAPLRIPEDGWFLDEAKNTAKDIMDLYDIDTLLLAGWRLSKDRIDDGIVDVSYGSADELPNVMIRFAPAENSESGWKVSRCAAYAQRNEELLTQAAEERKAFASDYRIEISETELKKAGYALEGEEELMAASAEYALGAVTEKFADLPEGSVLYCRDARPVELAFDVRYPEEGSYRYNAAAAVLPQNEGIFSYAFGDASDGWLYMGEAHPECRYYVKINMTVTAYGNDENGAVVFVEIQSEGATEPPAEQPTLEPTEEPHWIMDEHDENELRDFLDKMDEFGVMNGLKLFPFYESEDTETWALDGEIVDNFFSWRRDGTLYGINMRGADETALKLTSVLDLSVFTYLEEFYAHNVELDGLIARDLPSSMKDLDGEISANMVWGDAILTGGYVQRIYLRSAKHVLCDMNGEADTFISELPSFKINVTVEGKGFAGITAYDDENYYVIKLVAEPFAAGTEFVGWFDAEGKLVSTEPIYELFGEETGRSCEGARAELAFTARFK